ncbi:MAG: lipoyl synthase [Candidatus Margulisbacteria bacterium]|nr:lipoyl synthase [Candidatus Margulisiibacteriota bacterium]
MPLPNFLVKKTPKQSNIRLLRELIADPRIHTVCEEAKCPNIGECYSQKTCTFMILGDVCTRNCAFCGVTSGKPIPPDLAEPQQIAAAVEKLGLDYVVITSVTRDDLPDGGASHFAAILHALLVTRYSLRTEVLVPDFQGDASALQTVLDAKPFILNHNIETISRLYPKIRPQANYERSLKLLKTAAAQVVTKSGFMVGLGEEAAEVEALLSDLKAAGCSIVTIGQYLPPSKDHLQPERYVVPEEFTKYTEFGQKLGLKVFAGPFVRSSYHAGEIAG